MNIQDFFKNKDGSFRLNQDITVDCFIWTPGKSSKFKAQIQIKAGTSLTRNSYSNFGHAHSMRIGGRPSRDFVVVPYNAMDLVK